jgi:hypothetical protein
MPWIGHYILDENGEPRPCFDVMTWARWMEAANRHVAQDFVGAFHVSTVFLGLDHQWGDGPPVLRETMIFGPRAHELHMSQWRYASQAAAVDGHAAALEMVRRAQN